MKILIIGGGGREHALAWKTARSPRVEQVHVAPGNAGTAHEPKCANVAIAAEDIAALLKFAQQQRIDLTIVGPEAALVAGIVDRFTGAGLRCFGPSAAAARLEGSKVYAKHFMSRHGIPTASYASFTDPAAAIGFVQSHGAPIVVKADGLAAGKGVVVAATEAEAVRAIEDMLAARSFGAAGDRVVIEECLAGEEASFIALVDGEHWLPLASSQDHKRVDDGDTGPNTGGMGAYSPAPVVTPEIHERVMREVIAPTVRGLAADGHPYSGFLYAGLMIDRDGNPRVLEFNCRLGDPETQPILMRLQSDLVHLIEAALEGRLDQVQARWDARAALGVVMAAGGYPGAYRRGDAIGGLPPEQPDLKVFHAGTAERDGTIVTDGGRVLCVTALGAGVRAAQARAYQAAAGIGWKDAHYRRDIGRRALDWEN
jgi:phosphoribosylamine--glycine ligase